MKPVACRRMDWRQLLRRDAWKLFLALVFIGALAAGCVRAFFLLRAASLIYGLSPTPTPLIVRAYSKVFGHTIAESDFSIPGTDGPVPVRMIFPRDNPNAPIVVLVHGLAPLGYRDELLSVLAERLAKIGLRVVVPNISAEQHRLMRPSDLDEIGSAIRWSVNASGQRVSLFGISFGGGLVIAAADTPQYAGMLKLVFSDAGYNSIERLGRYYIGERVYGPDGHPYPPWFPGSGPLLIAFQYLDEMVPEQDVPIFHALILGEALNHSGGPAPPDILTPEQDRLYDDLRTAGSPEMREKYHRMLERHKSEMAVISPQGHMEGLRAPLFILHGLDDTSIPSGESLWTLHETAATKKVHVLISPWLSHAVLSGHVSFWTKLKVANFVGEVLHAAFESAPLKESGMHNAAQLR